MGQDPDAIRSEVEQTRERMGETIEALAYKSDVKSRAKESVSDKVDSVKSTITGKKDQVAGATPDAGQVKAKGRQAKGIAQDNPLGLAVGAVAVGFVAGLLVPSTRIEDEKIGEVADQVKDQVKGTAQEAVQHGKQVAQEAAQAAKETAQESGQQHAQEVKDSAQQSAQQVAGQAS